MYYWPQAMQTFGYGSMLYPLYRLRTKEDDKIAKYIGVCFVSFFPVVISSSDRVGEQAMKNFGPKFLLVYFEQKPNALLLKK